MDKFLLFFSFTDEISKLIENIKTNPFQTLLPFFLGIFFGFIIFFLVYFIVVLSSLKKTEKNASNVVLEVDDEIISNLVLNAKNKYIEESTYTNAARKIECLKECCWDLINDIAKTYYPKSKHPLFELSIDEFLILVNYISNRIDSLFQSKLLRKIKDIKLSSIVSIIDIKKKYDENAAAKKAVKAASGAANVWKFLNYFNPVYLIKKTFLDGTFNIILNKIAVKIIEVVADETAKVYSKNVFKSNPENDELEKEIDEIIKGGKYEKE